LTEIPAGSFDNWLENMRAVLRGAQSADVPCGDCVGCCVSSYQIPLRPDDRVALDSVPAEHLHLPVRPGALARMGHRADGTCPMLCGGKCSIYADRPQTCRDYDCRIYAATGLLPDGDRPVIRERVLAWRFSFDSPEARAAADALRRAAGFISANSSQLPDGLRPGSAAGAAVMAVKCLELFQSGELADSQSLLETVRIFDKTT
jgi:uncharacterized protein